MTLKCSLKCSSNCNSSSFSSSLVSSALGGGGGVSAATAAAAGAGDGVAFDDTREAVDFSGAGLVSLGLVVGLETSTLIDIVLGPELVEGAAVGATERWFSGNNSGGLGRRFRHPRRAK